MIFAMTGWDWFLVVVAALSIGIGLFRGLVRTVFALAAWVVALLGVPVAATYVLPAVVNLVPAWVVYVVVFLVLFVGTRLLGAMAARALHSVGLGGADRLMGGVLGAARAAIIVALVVVAAHVAGLSRQAPWQQAVAKPLLDTIVGWVEPFLPERLSGVRKT